MIEIQQPVAAGSECAVDRQCRACVVVPARNEEAGLPRTLDALRLQVTLNGEPLAADSYEVLLLLNNCTDRSAEVAAAYAARHPDFALRVLEATFAPAEAHVGSARRMLMDRACARLEEAERLRGEGVGAVLSTDADTMVAPDWIAANLHALAQGADAVGGAIELFTDEYAAMLPPVREAYERDRRYQALVARLESLLDPDAADPWPRHLHHFGASLACTTAAYRASGGMPAIKPLEDVAFVDRLRACGARLRHAPEVVVYTSARLDGRAEVGLSGQLRIWGEDAEARRPHQVESAAWLAHRFRTLAALRAARTAPEPSFALVPGDWHARIAAACGEQLPEAGFLHRIDADACIATCFSGTRHSDIAEALEKLEELVLHHAR